MIACDTCKNALVDGEYLPLNEKNRPICQAFPKGIPQDILDGALHREVRDDQDNDIVYEADRD